MPNRSPVVVLGLSLAACSGGKPPIATNPPEPVETTNPPEPEPIATNPPAMPTWDDVPSPHPAGATNPPRPVLLVSKQGECFKKWVSPMAPRNLHVDRIEDCADKDCGTSIQCPEERARPLLDALAAEGSATQKAAEKAAEEAAAEKKAGE